MNARPLALLLAALVALAGLVVPTAGAAQAAQAAPRVALQLPFSCGETWRGNDGASKYHKGLEIDFNKGWGSQDLGEKVLAAAAGTVQFAGNKGSGYGNYVQIRHPDKTYTLYAHMGKRLKVRKGQPVRQGQQIGTVAGSTGYRGSFDVHLHFEHKTRPDQKGFIRAVFDGKPYPYGRDEVFLKSNNCGQKKASPVRPVRPATGPVAHTALASLDGRTVRENSNDAYPDLYAKDDPVSVVCRTTGQTGYADPTWALTTDHVWVAGQYLSHKGKRGVSPAVRKCAVPTNVKSTVLLNTRSAKDMDAVAETDRYRKGDTVRVLCTALGGVTSQSGQHTWARTDENTWVPARYLDLRLTKAGFGAGLPRCDTDPARAAEPAPAEPAPAAGPVAHVALAGLDGRTVRDPGNHAYEDLYGKDDPVAVVCRSSGGLGSGYPDPTWALTTDHVWVAAHYLSHHGKRGVSPTVRDCAVPTVAKSTVLLNTRSAKDMPAVAETDRYRAGDPVRVVCTALGGPTSKTGQHTWARTADRKWVPARYLDLVLTKAGLGAGLPRCDKDPARPEKPAPAAPAAGPVAHVALAGLDGRTVRDPGNHAYRDLYGKDDPVAVVCRSAGGRASGYPDPTWALTTDHVWVAAHYLSHDGKRGVSPTVRDCAVPTNAKSTVLLNTRSAKDMDAVAEVDRYRAGDPVRVVCTALGGATSQTGQHTWARTSEDTWVPARYLDLTLTEAGLGAGLPRCDTDPARPEKADPAETGPERRDGSVGQPSEKLIEFLKAEEGLRLDYYTDPTGHCTVGYGRKVSDSPCTDAEERRPDISHEKAEEWLREDVRTRVDDTQRMTQGIPLAQNEWDALMSMVFNLGDYKLRVYEGKPSAFITTLKKGPAHYKEMPARIEMFDAADSPQVRCGLNLRRQREARMFTLGDYDSSKVRTCRP